MEDYKNLDNFDINNNGRYKFIYIKCIIFICNHYIEIVYHSFPKILILFFLMVYRNHKTVLWKYKSQMQA